MDKPILFCNIGWMEQYQGNGISDQIQGGGAYVKQHKTGLEVCNFSSYQGDIYGFVELNTQQIKLENLGANKNDEYINDVVVVWVATNPDSGGRYVIGWYYDAVVYRQYQKFDSIPDLHQVNNIYYYRIKVKKENARLLTLDERTCYIPKATKIDGGMGRSAIWYAVGEKNEAIVNRVKKFIERKQQQKVHKHVLNRSYDQEKKLLVERTAINVCCQYFESLGYSIRSVEKDNVGWDIEAIIETLLLKIEVKGLSGNNFTIELTPNEYRAFLLKDAQYRLAVVTHALTDEPKLWVCRFSDEACCWIAELIGFDQYQYLSVTERISAVIELTTKLN